MKADERETGRTSIYIYIEFAEYVVQWTHRRFNVGTWKRNVKPSIKRIYVTSTTNNRDFSFPFREREFCTSSSARFTASSDRIIPLSLRFFLNPRNFPFHSLLLSISERLTDIILFLRSLFYFFSFLFSIPLNPTNLRFRIVKVSFSISFIFHIRWKTVLNVSSTIITIERFHSRTRTLTIESPSNKAASLCYGTIFHVFIETP